MPVRTFRKPLASCTVVAILIGAGVVAAQDQGRAPTGGDPPTKATRTFLTPASCAPCHNQGAGPHPRFLGEPKGPRLVQLNEFEKWRVQDKHSHAYDALTGPRGQQMGKMLGYEVTTEQSCLSCHGTGFQASDLNGELPKARPVALEERDQGVGCAACHGTYKEWVGEHGLPGEPAQRWRTLSTKEKWESYGMTDLRDPVNRARVCYSCHIGDMKEGKVVSHAMYAAGHPPLPGIELATFQNAEPAHWWKATEVPLFKASPASAKPYNVDLQGLADTKTVVVGGVVAMRETLRLLASQAESKPEANARAAVYPDYAQFECYACHHDLEAPVNPANNQIEAFKNWRQQRDTKGVRPGGARVAVPGRPQPRLWALTLTRFAIRQAEGGAKLQQFDQEMRSFWSAFDKSPFGDPAVVAQEARALELKTESLLATLEASRFGPDAPARLIRELASLPEEGYLDYDSARQIAWAIKSIAAEWDQKPDAEQLDRLIGELDKTLKLDPYASRKPHADVITEGKLSGDPLTDALTKLNEGEYKLSLATAAAFNAETFKKTLAALKAVLPGPPNAAPIGGGGS